MFYINWTYMAMVLPALLLSMWASHRVNSTFNKYSQISSRRNITGMEACRRLLDSKGLYHVQIEAVSGKLSDHYDPRTNVIRLSSDVYSRTSCAAIGVACHEAGHAIQYAEKYAPIKFRNAIIPITNIGSKLAMPLVFIGLALSYASEYFAFLAYAGVILFTFVVLFQLFTLPTEFNASKRALDAIDEYRILEGEELQASKKVLSAAALTYVAALAVSISQLLYLLTRISSQRR